MAFSFEKPMKLIREIEDIGTIKGPSNLVSTFKTRLLIGESPVELTITKEDIENHALMAIDLRVFKVVFIQVYQDESGSQTIKVFMED